MPSMIANRQQRKPVQETIKKKKKYFKSLRKMIEIEEVENDQLDHALFST